MTIQQRGQMIQICIPVARGGALDPLNGKVDHSGRHAERRKGPRVQFVGKPVAQRVIFDGGHVHGSLV